MKRVGFTNIDVVSRQPFGIDQARLYPLFTGDVIELMDDLIPPERHDRIAVSITVTADNPA
jgi:arsenite methyltransferase